MVELKPVRFVIPIIVATFVKSQFVMAIVPLIIMLFVLIMGFVLLQMYVFALSDIQGNSVTNGRVTLFRRVVLWFVLGMERVHLQIIVFVLLLLGPELIVKSLLVMEFLRILL